MNQKQSWEEEFENMPLEYFADSVFSTSGNPSEFEFINWQRETTRRAMQKKEFFKKIICRAIQTRERELREEWQKLETISKEVEIDNLAMQYELGREDREREISEEVGKMKEKNTEPHSHGGWSDGSFCFECEDVRRNEIKNDTLDEVLSIINNKS